jgi:hypothetical protein
MVEPETPQTIRRMRVACRTSMATRTQKHTRVRPLTSMGARKHAHSFIRARCLSLSLSVTHTHTHTHTHTEISSIYCFSTTLRYVTRTLPLLFYVKPRGTQSNQQSLKGYIFFSQLPSETTGLLLLFHCDDTKTTKMVRIHYLKSCVQ